MKIFSKLIKILKYFLWLLFGSLIICSTIGLIKNGNGIKDYIFYLNNKDRNETISNISIKNPSSLCNFFRDKNISNINSTGEDNINTNNIQNNIGKNNTESGNSEINNDFLDFFEDTENNNDEDNNINNQTLSGKINTGENFGFKNIDSES